MRNKNTTLAIRLFSIINSESPASTDHQIAKYLLENIQTLDLSTTESLAQSCNASKASVSRFCKNIGLNDFFELKSHILHFKLETKRKMELQLPSCKNMPEIRREYINDIIVKLTMMRDCLEDRKIDELVNDLKSGRKVTVMGHMQSGNTARNMQYNLFVCNKIVTALTRSTTQIEYLRSAEADDVVVIFSVSGDFLENLYYGEPHFMPRKKPKIYLITTNPTVENKPYADVVYNCRTGWQLSGGNTSLEVLQQLISLSYYYSVKNML